jgi:hypothetical protein
MDASRSKLRQLSGYHKKIEEACLRRMFGPARYGRGITSKRHQDEHPTELPVYTEINGVFRLQQIPLAEHPAPLFMEAFNPPGLFSGRSASESARNYRAGIWIDNQRLRVPEGAQSVYTDGWVNHFMMARMLAKIAHGMAVFTFGLDGFKPVLLDIISGKDLRETFYYIGVKPDMSEKDTYPLDLRCGIERTTGCVTVTIRLFANLGAPVYVVAVGDPTQEAMEMLASSKGVAC